MKLVNGAIELEQCERPGSIGDSCAETARYAHLRMLTSDYFLSDYNLFQFETPMGYVRHPEAPDDWKERDFSSDQALPLYLAYRRGCYNRESSVMERRFKGVGYRTGNGDLLSPGLFAEMYAPWLRVPLLLAQLAIFKFKWRWNDEKNKFEENEESSCDYLNFIHVAAYAPRWLRRRISPSTLYEKVRHYYSPEPDCVFLKSLYFNVLNTYFGREAR